MYGHLTLKEISKRGSGTRGTLCGPLEELVRYSFGGAVKA